MCGWQVKLCDPLVTHESYPSALRGMVHNIKALYKYQIYFTFSLFMLRHDRNWRHDLTFQKWATGSSLQGNPVKNLQSYTGLVNIDISRLQTMWQRNRNASLPK